MGNAVRKRIGYSTIRSLPDGERGKALARMMRENPQMVRYFRKKGIFARLFYEIPRMVASNEDHRRKEELRAALYPFAEPHLNDGKLAPTNIGASVKSVLGNARDFAAVEKGTDVKYSEVERSAGQMSDPGTKIDSGKILRDREWYRGIIRWLASAGAMAAVALALIPEHKEEVVQDDRCEQSLKVCVDALASYEDPMVRTVTVTKTKEVKLEPKKDEYCSDLLNAKNGELASLNAKLDELRKDSAKLNEYRLLLIEKIDFIFNSIATTEGKKFYINTARKWFKEKLDRNDEAMIALGLHMGGELLKQELEDGTIKSLGKISSPQEFKKILEGKRLLYTGGKAGKDNEFAIREGSVQALFEFYQREYELFGGVLKKVNARKAREGNDF